MMVTPALGPTPSATTSWTREKAFTRRVRFHRLLLMVSALILIMTGCYNEVAIGHKIEGIVAEFSGASMDFQRTGRWLFVTRGWLFLIFSWCCLGGSVWSPGHGRQTSRSRMPRDSLKIRHRRLLRSFSAVLGLRLDRRSSSSTLPPHGPRRR